MFSKWAGMICAFSIAACCVLATAQDAASSAGLPQDVRAETQPATPSRDTQRRPGQAEVLESLLRRERSAPIFPTDREGAGVTPDRDGLLLDGDILRDRPGRISRTGDRTEFVLIPDEGHGSPQSFPLLENQWLELMEEQADLGFTQFRISAEITRYRGQNYLLLRKVLRVVENRNLAP